MKIDLSHIKEKKDKFKYLIENKELFIAQKKSVIKYADSFGLAPMKEIGLSVKQENQDTFDELFRTIIGNTYNFMDSHDDVHVSGNFSKSIKERKGKIFHLRDHKFEITAKVGEPIKIYEKAIEWEKLGIKKEGNTESLMMDSRILREYNEKIFKLYGENKINQHSVGMQYVKIDLAINDEEYKEEYKNWEKVFPLLGNQDLALEVGFFWIVREAKLIEISAVLLGSNELTPTLSNENKIDEPLKSTREKINEPSDEDTRKKQLMLHLLKN